jgi:hypothetical protein
MITALTSRGRDSIAITTSLLISTSGFTISRSPSDGRGTSRRTMPTNRVDSLHTSTRWPTSRPRSWHQRCSWCGERGVRHASRLDSTIACCCQGRSATECRQPARPQPRRRCRRREARSRRSIAARAAGVWLLIIAAEMVHGLARTRWLTPALRDFRARQVAVLSGSLIVLIIVIATVRWTSATRTRALLKIGCMWSRSRSRSS